MSIVALWATCSVLTSVPRVHFERSAYSVQEPSVGDQITTVTLKVMRSGDVSKTAEVRCSTKDGSAMSGIDYNPKSQILRFKEGLYISYFLKMVFKMRLM